MQITKGESRANIIYAFHINCRLQINKMKFTFWGRELTIRFVKGTYRNNGNLYVGIQSFYEDEGWGNFCDITVNTREKCPENCGFLNANLSNEVYRLIRPYIKETGRAMDNGFTKYPEVCFDKNFLDSATKLV